ncbi:MAG: hypothetical protein ACYC0A_13325 [Lutibacter sp.]
MEIPNRLLDKRTGKKTIVFFKKTILLIANQFLRRRIKDIYRI